MIEFSDDYKDSKISFKRGKKFCNRCNYKTYHERYHRVNPFGIITQIYRCEECDKLTTIFKNRYK